MAFNNFEIILHKIFFDSNPYEFLPLHFDLKNYFNDQYFIYEFLIYNLYPLNYGLDQIFN